MPTRHSNATELIAGLNEDLANEYASVIQYRTYASTLRGAHRLTLRSLFEAEIADELSHAGLLADAIAARGGTPITRPAPVGAADSPLAMLRQAYDAELGALARYVERRGQAEAAGEHGLAVSLDDVIADETRHRDEFGLVLDGWDSGAGEDGRGTEQRRHEPESGRGKGTATRHRAVAGSAR